MSQRPRGTNSPAESHPRTVHVAKHEDAWTEDDIRARTDALIARVATIWPRPNVGLQQTGPVALTTERTPDGPTETAEETADDASHMGKYRLLWQWLQDQGRDEISLTFADVEQVLAMPLPQSARRHPTHWYGYEGTALGQVNLTDETVILKREETQGAGEDES
jgi:hypothetical protein